MAIDLSTIMEGKPIPKELHPATSETIGNICRTAEPFLWKVADDFYSTEDTRDLDDLASALAVIMNAVAQEVVGYRTDFIHDILNMQRIMRELEFVELLHQLPVYIIGIRKYGTDHWAFIHSRMESEGYEVYAAIYLVTFRDDGMGQTHMKVYRAVGMKPDAHKGRR